MKRKVLSILLILSMTAGILTGCGEREVETTTNHIADNTAEGVIDYQTAEGINLEDEDAALTSGTFYVVHKEPDTEDKKGRTVTGDTIYYPAYLYLRSYEEGDLPTSADSDRQLYYTTENEISIPTLFLGQGDTLIYYDETSLLDYVTWERYYDLGYTIGVCQLEQLTNGKYYLNLSDDNESMVIIPDSELYSLYDLGVESILLDQLGGHEITEDMVSDGLLIGATKSRSYDLDVYAGTYYHHYTATANIHAFKSYEVYASIEMIYLQEYTWEITIPDYFVDGYYVLNDLGMVRIVRESSYSDDTEFNEQLLFPEVDDEDSIDYNNGEISYEDAKKVAPAMYSEYEPLNRYSTDQEGTLGYVDPDAEEEEAELTEKEQIVLKEASVYNTELYFPADKECKIVITSPTLEKTGDADVYLDGNTYDLIYDNLAGEYSVTITGSDALGRLTVTGLFESYDISLEGCYVYEGSERQIYESANGTVRTVENSSEESVSAEENTEEGTEESTEGEEESEEVPETRSRR